MIETPHARNGLENWRSVSEDAGGLSRAPCSGNALQLGSFHGISGIEPEQDLCSGCKAMGDDMEVSVCNEALQKSA
ncbi:hypothetical protein [Chelatococcus asaccharovorans]|uniref:hypothetical protein n=1 Tax=Chelatococcus asaccharovorans TaxID=28210 RepID=UPI0011B75AB4|nr:hypothetical protein [Chelatococcus asaccharovorans]MBS7704789.1 hypothetical protein [Chelatococcus asaccharovorans]